MTPPSMPTPTARVSRSKLPGSGKVVVIDPGHGGKDQGATTQTGPLYQEKNLNLAVACHLQRLLSQWGITAKMTRSSDVFVPLKDRSAIANRLNADLFLSVHFNTAPNSEAHGIEVFYYQPDKASERTHRSEAFAVFVLDELLREIRANSRGVKCGDFIVIRETKMPAVLIEGGFISNAEELESLKDPSYLKRIAYGIAKGIKNYLESLEQRLSRG